MRIERVDLVNFGPHFARTWEPGAARLTVVTGPNGAGKSSLLVDAPLWAIFGDVPDGSGPAKLVRIGATDMSVTVELVLDGLRYRIVRRRTAKAGGKTSADLQVQLADGSWKPVVSGPDVVSAEMSRLLHMDQSTFRSVVILAQRDAWRFMDATPGKGTPTAPGRAAVLSTIVVDPRFALAEISTREEIRILEVATEPDRRLLAGLDAQLAGRDVAETNALVAVERAENATAAVEEAGRWRDAVEETMRSLSGRLAEARAATDELARIDAELVALRERYRRATESRSMALGAITRTRAAAEAEIPEVDVEAARAEVARLEAAEERERVAAAEVAAARTALSEVEATWERAVAEWRRRQSSSVGLVAALEDQAAHLDPVTCPNCATSFPADPGDVAGRLAAARAALEGLGSEPAEPPWIAAAFERVEVAKARVVEVDPQALRAAREALATADRASAAIAARDAARASLADAEATLAAADAERAEIDATGQAVALTKTAATERAAEAATVAADLALAEMQRRQAIAAAAEAAGRHADAAAVLANARSALERLAAAQAERDRLGAQVAEAEVTLARLRRLVVAFGVKGIPARVVEGVLPELVAHANDMLGQLRPGMTLDLRATRAKADGSGTIEALDIWIRDEAGERQRWSGGEGTSIAMSIAIALSRLGARRAGARVATLVIDEPDGLDAESRRAFGQALRVLAHRGDLERVAVITHQDGIPDFADAVVEMGPAAVPAQ